MGLNLEAKAAIVSEVADVASKALSAVAAEYRGLSVEEMTQLRVQARQSGVYLRVVRNTLARRAMADTDFECMQEGLVGPLVLAFSLENPGAAARLMADYSGKNDKLVVKLIAIGGQLVDPSEIKRVASLPTREEALASLMAVMKAPVGKFVRTLAEPHAKLVRTVAALRDQKEAA